MAGKPLLAETHPELVSHIDWVADGTPVEKLTRGKKVKVGGTCRTCGQRWERLLPNAVARGACAHGARKGSEDALTLEMWVRRKMADATAAEATGLDHCHACEEPRRGGERSGGQRARVYSPLHGRWVAIDRKRCAHGEAKFWGTTLLLDLVNLADAKLPSRSNRVIAWACHLCGNKWSDTVAHRTQEGRACPACTRSQRSMTNTETPTANGRSSNRDIPSRVAGEFVGVVVSATPRAQRLIRDHRIVPRHEVELSSVVTSAKALRRDEEEICLWKCSICDATWGEDIDERLDHDARNPGCPAQRAVKSLRSFGVLDPTSLRLKQFVNKLLDDPQMVKHLSFLDIMVLRANLNKYGEARSIPQTIENWGAPGPSTQALLRREVKAHADDRGHLISERWRVGNPAVFPSVMRVRRQNQRIKLGRTPLPLPGEHAAHGGAQRVIGAERRTADNYQQIMLLAYAEREHSQREKQAQSGAARRRLAIAPPAASGPAVRGTTFHRQQEG